MPPLFTAALFTTIAKSWKQPKYRPTDERIRHGETRNRTSLSLEEGDHLGGSMDGPRDCHTDFVKWPDREMQILQATMRGIQTEKTHELIYKAERLTSRKQNQLPEGQ